MTIGDILVNTNRANLNNLLPLSEVKTKKDFAKFKKKGYTVGMTAGEFQEKYPLLPIENIYASYNILSSLYYCEPQNPTIPIVLNLQIYGYNYRLSRRGQQINAVYAVFLVDGQLQSSLFLCLQVAER